MVKARTKAKRFLRSERGATAIEYGLIAGLLVIAIAGAVGTVGQTLQNNLYNKIASVF